MPSRANVGINPIAIEDALTTLSNVSSFPIREDQAGMTPEQRKIVNEIMTKVFEVMQSEGRTLNDKALQWMTRKRQKP